MQREIARYGKILADRGFVKPYCGNIGIRLGDKMLIKRSGKYLEKTDEEAVVEVDIERVSELDRIASSDTPIHRAVYKNTTAKAVIHAHSPYAVIESLIVFRDKVGG